MRKSEVMALGVPEEKYQEFQEMYNRDVNMRIKSKIAKEKESVIRETIYNMLQLIKNQETLEHILRCINTAYYKEKQYVNENKSELYR